MDDTTQQCDATHPDHGARCTVSARTVHNRHRSGTLVWVEVDKVMARCSAGHTGERCHYAEGHAGAHRSEHTDWPNAPLVCAADTEHGACLRRPGHSGEHAWRTVTAQALDRGEAWRPRATEDVHLPQPGEEWPPIQCGVLFVGPDGDHTTCNVVSGHIGSHQHLPVGLNSDADEKRLADVRERRCVKPAALTRLRRELREELQYKLGTLERSVDERLEALEKRLADVREMTQDEQPDQVAEPDPRVTVYGIDVSEWDRRLGTLEKRAEQVTRRVNKAEARIMTSLESGFHLVLERQKSPEPASDTCAYGDGEPWCTQRNGHDGECDPDPSAQVPRIRRTGPAVVADGVPGLSDRCTAVLRIGASGVYQCTLDQGHDDRHTDEEGDRWSVTEN